MADRRWTFFPFLLAGLLLGNVSLTAYGVETPPSRIEMEFEFESDREDTDKKELFAECIVEDGITYQLADIQYETVSKEPVMEPVKKMIESPPVPAGQEYTPEEVFLENGVVYVMESTKEKETAIRTQQVTGYTDYSHPVTRADVPATKEVMVADGITGESMVVKAELKDIQPAYVSWENSYIDIVFERYDAENFEWMGQTVSKDTQTPLSGYENELLASIGADSSQWQVLTTYWTGDAYTGEDGVLRRNARADVRRRITYYRASYEGETELQDIVYETIYRGEQAKENAYRYKIKAVAAYEKMELPKEKHPLVPYVAAGAGILLAAGCIVLILFLLTKKRKEGGK